jgi:LacI family transcriptional regulator
MSARGDNPALQPASAAFRGRPRPAGDRILKVALFIESSRSSGRALLTGISNYARYHGRWAFYWEPGGLAEAWPRLRSLDADGIILRDFDAVDEVMALGLPAIVVGHRRGEIPGVANVITDSVTIGQMAAEHLLERRFQHFAYCGFENTPWSTIRGEVFSRRVAEAGYPTQLYTSPPPSPTGPWKRELQRMARWLRTLPQPLGLMACNDDRGQQVIEACKISGLRVPEQIAIIGADNDELVCELSDPPLSSVAINFERAGFESAELLNQLMRGRRTQPTAIHVHATHVVTRRSTDILALEDHGIVKALRYIQAQARGPIHVNDVARAAGLSRRVLEKRFRKLLDRSVLHQIRRVRVDQICRMLMETNEPVSQIAFTLGYTGEAHIARYFRAERGMTPLAYRRRYAKK